MVRNYEKPTWKKNGYLNLLSLNFGFKKVETTFQNTPK